MTDLFSPLVENEQRTYNRECYWCQQIVTINRNKDWQYDSAWLLTYHSLTLCRFHVLDDLEPYQCMEINCPCADATYNRRLGLEDHYARLHPSASIMSTELYTCLFCDEVVYGKPSTRFSHVGRHMEEMAFAIVPRQYEAWEFYSDAGTSVRSILIQDSSSRMGTYSCTYHGCTQRFDFLATLQQHKREKHRQHGVSARPSAVLPAASHAESQGHRCDRINPSTGKPCGTVFSRPYDLTRHEDTIHNARKQKVRCHLCTAEKTFSRNDALNRQTRVAHPDADWAGKPKKRAPK